MTTYFALVIKDDDSAYGVVFPDVPGCFSAGDTFEDAVRNAGEALRLHVECARELGRGISAPRDFDALLADAEVRKDARMATLIPVRLTTGGDPVEISIPFEQGLLDAVDAAAARSGVSRTEFLAEAVREKVAG